MNEIKKKILKVYDDYKTGNFASVDDEFLINFRRDYLTEKLTKEFQFSINTGVH